MVNDFQKKIELKWQKKWKKDKVFEPKIDLKREKYFATIAYPYANSVMHIGHGRTSTICDIYSRYQRVCGKNVLFPMGFHITGTPVLAVAENIARGDKKQLKITCDAISDYVFSKDEEKKLLESFKEPMNIAKFFSSKIEESFDKIGLSIDWSRQFTTGDKSYNKFIAWQFKKLKDAGILVQGKYPILYSPIDKNAVGEDDISDGDTDKVAVQEMNFILFKFKDSEDYLAIATLRPDALFGTTNLWVDSSAELVKVRVNGKNWIVSKEALVKIEHQYDETEVISYHGGNEFIGKLVVVPILDREVLVADASFIDPLHGTGIVYSSPAGSPQDYISLVEAKNDGRLPKDIKVINTVDIFDKKKNKVSFSGSCFAEDKCLKFKVKSSNDSDSLELAKQELYKEEHYGGVLNENAGEFSGIPIKVAKDKVLSKLNDLGLGGVFYETSRRAKTRGGEIVIVAVLDEQWFLDYSKSETKKKAFDVLENMTYNPHRMRQTQEGYIDWASMRPCARKRGLGTKLPYDPAWVIEALSDSTIYQMFYLVVNIINREKISSSKLSVEFFDYVMLGEGNVILISESSGIDKKLILEMREQVKYWKSFNFRYTASTHMSNHLNFLIYHYGIIFNKEFWPKNITIGGLLVKDGEKISKSKGNGIPLFRIKDIYGADLYRLYIAVGANYDIEMDFKEEEIFQLERKLEKWNSLIAGAISRKKKGNFDGVSKWLISKFYSRVKEYFSFMDDMRIREAYVSILYEFLNDIAYHERRTSLDETLDVIRFILEDYLILMTPVIPHTTEEFFEKFGGKGVISLKNFKTDPNKFIDKNIEDIEEIGQALITLISKTKESKKMVKINKIEIIQSTSVRFELFDDLGKLLAKTNEFKEILPVLMKKFGSDKKFIQKFVPKTLSNGLNTYLSKADEKVYLLNLIDFLKEEFNCSDIVISDSDKLGVNLISIIPGRVGVNLS